MITAESIQEILDNPVIVTRTLEDMGYSRFRIRHFIRGLQRLTRHAVTPREEAETVNFGE